MICEMEKTSGCWGKYLEGDLAQLEELSVTLVTGCEKGGVKILALLLEAAVCDHPNVSLTSQVLLGMECFNLFYRI